MTHDADFLSLAQSGMDHDGIVFMPHANTSIGTAIRYLSLLNDCFTIEEMKNRIEYMPAEF